MYGRLLQASLRVVTHIPRHHKISNNVKQFSTIQYLSSSIKHVNDDKKKSMIHINWNNGEDSSYPHIFLRDNCQCEQCFHPHALSRKLNIFVFRNIPGKKRFFLKIITRSLDSL